MGVVSWRDIDRLRSEVEELEIKRIKQFTALNLEERCRLIALHLGKPKQDTMDLVREFKDGDLYIRYVSLGDMIHVKYRGNIVLSVADGTLYLYRPGKWLGKVIQLSKRLLEEELEKEYVGLLARKKNWEAIEE